MSANFIGSRSTQNHTNFQCDSTQSNSGLPSGGQQLSAGQKHWFHYRKLLQYLLWLLSSVLSVGLSPSKRDAAKSIYRLLIYVTVRSFPAGSNTEKAHIKHLQILTMPRIWTGCQFRNVCLGSVEQTLVSWTINLEISFLKALRH